MIRRPPRSTQSRSSAASDVYKRQVSSASALPYHLGAHPASALPYRPRPPSHIIWDRPRVRPPVSSWAQHSTGRQTAADGPQAIPPFRHTFPRTKIFLRLRRAIRFTPQNFSSPAARHSRYTPKSFFACGMPFYLFKNWEVLLSIILRWGAVSCFAAWLLFVV